MIDLFFSVYPPYIVSRLNMPLRKKITVMVIFGLSLFALFTTLFKTAAELPKLRYEDVDVSWVLAQVMLWTILEASVVIVAGSIPTWGWVFRTEEFSRFVTWISLHSPWATRLSEHLPSHGERSDNESDRMGLKTSREGIQESQGESVTLQSITRIEKIACS